MGVYHFTLHAYRSWSPSHPRGYTERGRGYQPPDPEPAEEYDEQALFPRVTFDLVLQRVLVLGIADFCQRRHWRLHAVATDPTHVHFVVSWRGFMLWNVALRRVKNVLSLLLGRVSKQSGRRWFVSYSSRKRVRDEAHLSYLVTQYLPDHRGAFWREGMPLPSDEYRIL